MILQNNLVFLTYAWNPEKDVVFRKFHKQHLLIQEMDTIDTEIIKVGEKQVPIL